MTGPAELAGARVDELGKMVRGGGVKYVVFGLLTKSYDGRPKALW